MWIHNDAHDNIIGAYSAQDSSFKGNIISGNENAGVIIDSYENQVADNYSGDIKTHHAKKVPSLCGIPIP